MRISFAAAVVSAAVAAAAVAVLAGGASAQQPPTQPPQAQAMPPQPTPQATPATPTAPTPAPPTQAPPAPAAPPPVQSTPATPTPAQPTPAPPTATPTPPPPHAYLYIGWPNDGQVVSSGKPIRVWFGLRNMGVAPKGVAFPNTGHHHLLIDTDPPAPGAEIPSDRNHLHYGTGETETTIELPPGKHTLQLLMGDQNHVSFNPPVVSKKITITVQ